MVVGVCVVVLVGVVCGDCCVFVGVDCCVLFC